MVDVVDAAELVKHNFGRLDVLVSNTGYMESTSDFDPKAWWRPWTVNIWGISLCVPPAAVGDNKIINVTSARAHMMNVHSI